jgi:branched-chain amino acid transport system ATP-binding protein
VTSLLSVDELSVSYGAIRAVRNVSMAIEQGEIVALLGANGAGKSTTLKGIIGLVRPRAGRITFDGVDIFRQPTETIVRRGITLTPEGRRVFSALTVDENLSLGALAANGGRTAIAATRAEMYSLFPRLADRRSQLAGTLSGGEQQQLAIARSLMSHPRLLMLDEPSLGLAPQITARLFELVRDLRERGLTILLVEQNVSATLRIADRVYLLDHGEVVASGTAEQITASGRINRAYLGARAETPRGSS